VTEPVRSGTGGERGTAAADRASADPERRAEEWAEKVGRWVARSAARAREEAEDIWADAQVLRRKL
jgi:hypothetical protein